MTSRVLAAVLALVATPALAQPVVATLERPLAEKTRFIAGGAVFVCEGGACTAAAPLSDTLSTAACKVVAAKVGPLSAFAGARPLDAEKLAACNAAAKRS